MPPVIWTISFRFIQRVEYSAGSETCWFKLILIISVVSHHSLPNPPLDIVSMPQTPAQDFYKWIFGISGKNVLNIFSWVVKIILKKASVDISEISRHYGVEHSFGLGFYNWRRNCGLVSCKKHLDSPFIDEQSERDKEGIRCSEMRSEAMA